MIGHINSNLPDDFQELISVSQSKYAKYKPVKDIYTKALHKNIANLSLTVTPENSISMNSYGSTRWVFTEFYYSCKPFLILVSYEVYVLLYFHKIHLQYYAYP